MAIIGGVPRGYLTALGIRPVAPGMFRNRLKRGANDAYNDLQIHTPTLNQGHPICGDLWSLRQNRVRHETSNK